MVNKYRFKSTLYCKVYENISTTTPKNVVDKDIRSHKTSENIGTTTPKNVVDKVIYNQEKKKYWNKLVELEVKKE